MLAGKVEIKMYVKFGILCLFKCDPKKIIHQWKAYLFSFEMTYKSKFHKMYLYDWFCGPRSQIRFYSD